MKRPGAPALRKPAPPRDPRSFDLGVEAPMPVPADAPRSIADLPAHLRKPAKPPPSHTIDPWDRDPAGFAHLERG